MTRLLPRSTPTPPTSAARRTGRRGIALLAAVLAVTMPLSALPALATTRGDGLRAAANERRATGDLPAVVGTDLLDSVAKRRANQMATADELAHNMAYVQRQLDEAGTCWTGFGEIIAYSWGDYSYDHTITQWWNSSPHKAIMMGESYNAAGGSWAPAASGGNYSVMIFVTLCPGELAASEELLTPQKRYSPNRPMVFRAGTHTAYKLSSAGDVLSTKQVTFATRTRADAAGRARVNGRAYLKVSTGAFAGWWVRESAKSFVRGTTQRRNFASPRPLAFDAGTYTGYTFDRLGRRTGSRSYTLSRDSGADAAARAIINGKAWWLIDNGIWSGYWIRDTRSVNPAR